MHAPACGSVIGIWAMHRPSMNFCLSIIARLNSTIMAIIASKLRKRCLPCYSILFDDFTLVLSNIFLAILLPTIIEIIKSDSDMIIVANLSRLSNNCPSLVCIIQCIYV